MLRPRSTSETNGGKKSTSETSRAFTFTLNNYTPEELRRVEHYPEWIRWIGYGKEVAPTTQTPHLQGFVYTWDPVRLTKFKGFLRRAHIEVQRGSFEENETYCNKDKDWTEYGERPQQGRRNDILGMKRRLDQGTSLDELMEDEAFFSTAVRNERALRKYEETQRGKKLRAQPRAVPRVYLLQGESGHGKTPTIKKLHGHESVYSVFSTKCPWYDGYRGEPVIVFEDIDSSTAPPIKHFKDICDGYPIQVPIKGGATWCMPTHVYVTSNESPAFWYPGQDKHYQAIENRFDEIWDFKKEYPYGVYKVIHKNENRRGNVLPENGRLQEEEEPIQNPLQEDQAERSDFQRQEERSREDDSSSGSESD